MDAKSYHSISDTGRERELNEDSYGQVPLPDGGVLLIVCDGMGGHEGGEVASKLAVEAIGQIFVNSPSTDPREKLMSGFRVANQRILSTAEKNGTEGMGTTAVAAYVVDGSAMVAHVGDSRAYLVRDGVVRWRSKDHTRVQKMIDRGIIEADQAKEHPDANVVTRALGYRETSDGEPIEPDIEAVDLEPGDRLMLCSDGLYDLVTDDEIGEIEGTPAQIGQRLVDTANERGGHDNITVAVVHVPTRAAMASVQRAPAKGATPKKDRITDLEDDPPPVSVSRTATKDKNKKGRTTELEESADRARRRVAAATPVDKRPDRRTLIAVVMFVVAAAIAVAVWKLSSGSTPSNSGATTTTPRPTGDLGSASTDDQPPPDPAVGSDEAPPLPENPVLDRPTTRPPGKTKGSADDPMPADPYADPPATGSSAAPTTKPASTPATPTPTPTRNASGKPPAGATTKPAAGSATTKPAAGSAATKPAAGAATKPAAGSAATKPAPAAKPTAPVAKPAANSTVPGASGAP